MTQDKIKIGNNIRKYREAAGLTRAELAEKSSVAKQHITYVERGGRLPSLENFIRIVNALSVSPNWILNDVLDEPEQKISDDLLEAVKELSPKERKKLTSMMEILFE